MSSKSSKAVRILAEHFSSGIWHVPGWPRESLDGFWLSTALYARLQRWVEHYCELDRAEGYTGECDLPEWADFNAEGYAIAFAIKAELPDWQVIYVDETLWSPHIRLSVPIEIPGRLN